MRPRCMATKAATSLVFFVLSAPGRAQVTGLGARFQPPPNAMQAAQIVGVEPLIAKLSALSADNDVAGDAGMSLEELALRQQITEAVVAGSLDVDSAFDGISYELAQVVELRSILLSQRQRAIGSASLATLALSAGLGVVSGVLQFSDTTKSFGDGVGFASGGISALLSLRSMRQQHGRKLPGWVLPNMLSPFFFPSQEEAGKYPAGVWDYLNSVPPGSASETSRKEQLLARWQTAGRFPPVDSPSYQPRIVLLTDTNAINKKLNIDLLSERAAMLADVRDQVSFMKRDLGDLVRSIRIAH